METETNCRSETGVTVSLIDGIIAICRVLNKRDLSAIEVHEAIKDLLADEDVSKLMKDSNQRKPL